MRQAVLILNIVALVFSIIWMINSNYEYEPIIVSITFIATLIGIIYNKDFLSNTNKSTIKGSKNVVHQGNKNSKIETDKKNQSKIDGDENEVKQNN
jgi:hypothetical protein